MDGRRNVGQLAQEMAVVCDIPQQAEMVQDDVLEVLVELAKQGLVAQL